MQYKSYPLDAEAEKKFGPQKVILTEKDFAGSLKSVLPGDLIVATNSKGQFRALGMANRDSQFFFRVLTKDISDCELDILDLLQKKILIAWKKRLAHGFKNSFRLVFAEGDSLPGLIMDHYVLVDGRVFISIQLNIYGMDRLLKDRSLFFKSLVEKAFQENLTQVPADQFIFLIRKDSPRRIREGLNIEPTVQLGKVLNSTENTVQQILISGSDNFVDRFTCDLIQGQKTGFFLDQAANVDLVQGHFLRSLQEKEKTKVRILDLFCHLGQWSIRVGGFLERHQISCNSVMMDASADALNLAQQNLDLANLKGQGFNRDLLKNFPAKEPAGSEWGAELFDLVICDPPAFVKSKKDLAAGSRAYLKLNTQAMRWVTPSGFFATASCSGNLNESDFLTLVKRASGQAGRKINLVAKGGQPKDHPLVSGFTQGQYLKFLLFQIE